MDIAYSREAMHALLALRAPVRARVVAAAQEFALPAATGDDPASRLAGLLHLADGSDFCLAPYSASGDLVVTRRDDTLIVLALIDVIGALREAAEQ